MAPAPRVAYAILCDDIRVEYGNKISLMGIYGSDLQLTENFPLMLPKFAVHVGLICDLSDAPAWLKVSMILPDGAELFNIEFPIASISKPQDIDATVTKYRVGQNIPITPLPLLKSGYLEVWLETETGKLRAGRLKITSIAEQAAITAANTPPTPGSPDDPAPRR